jgi:CBS domain-containing protein
MYEFLKYRVSEVMASSPVTIAPGASLAEVEDIFSRHHFNGLPVVDARGRLLGLLTTLDVLKAFAFTPASVIPPYSEITKQPAERFMTRDPLTFEPDAPLTHVLEQMVRSRYKSFPVVAGERLVGMVAREDVLRALKEVAARG